MIRLASTWGAPRSRRIARLRYGSRSPARLELEQQNSPHQALLPDGLFHDYHQKVRKHSRPKDLLKYVAQTLREKALPERQRDAYNERIRPVGIRRQSSVAYDVVVIAWGLLCLNLTGAHKSPGTNKRSRSG